MERRRPGEQAGRRHGRELEASVGDGLGIEQEQADARQAEGRYGLAAPARLAGDDDGASHQGGTQDARRGAGQKRVAEDDDQNDD